MQSTSLEFGARPGQRLITIMYAPLRTCETIRVGKYFVDVSRIVHPISRNIEGTADDQSVGNQIDKSGLYDATLVVSFLRPGVWKIQIYTRDRCGRNLLTQDLDRIVIYKAQINDAGLARSQQTMPYARIMHLNSQKILPGVLRRLFDESLAIAETDFQHDGLTCLEGGTEFCRAWREFQAVNRPQLGKRLLLRRRQATAAAYETAYGSNMAVLHGRYFRISCARWAEFHWIDPGPVLPCSK